METIISMRLSELNSEMLDKIREFITDVESADVTVTIKENNYDFMKDFDFDFGMEKDKKDISTSFPEDEQ